MNGIQQQAIRIPVKHMVYNYYRGWQQVTGVTSPTLAVRFKVFQQAYVDLQLTPPATTRPGQPLRSAVRRAVADTGAQMNVMDIQTAKEMGINISSLIPSTMTMRGAARGSTLDVEGAVFVELEVPGAAIQSM